MSRRASRHPAQHSRLPTPRRVPCAHPSASQPHKRYSLHSQGPGGDFASRGSLTADQLSDTAQRALDARATGEHTQAHRMHALVPGTRDRPKRAGNPRPLLSQPAGARPHIYTQARAHPSAHTALGRPFPAFALAQARARVSEQRDPDSSSSWQTACAHIGARAAYANSPFVVHRALLSLHCC